jgi:hypothetical protein
MICTSKGKSVGLLLGLSYSHAPPTLLYSMLVYKTTGLLPHLACAQYTRYPPSQLARGKGVLALPLYLPSQFCLYLVERGDLGQLRVVLLPGFAFCARVHSVPAKKYYKTVMLFPYSKSIGVFNVGIGCFSVRTCPR